MKGSRRNRSVSPKKKHNFSSSMTRIEAANTFTPTTTSVLALQKAWRLRRRTWPPRVEKNERDDYHSVRRRRLWQHHVWVERRPNNQVSTSRESHSFHDNVAPFYFTSLTKLGRPPTSPWPWRNNKKLLLWRVHCLNSQRSVKHDTCLGQRLA